MPGSPPSWASPSTPSAPSSTAPANGSKRKPFRCTERPGPRNRRAMNSCPDRDLLAAYVDRRLADTDALEAHLAACPDCRAEVVALADLVAQVAASDRRPSALRPPVLTARRWGRAIAAGVAA